MGTQESEEEASQSTARPRRLADRVWLVAIAGGIASSALYSVIQPMILNLGHSGIFVASQSYTRFIDGVYRNAHRDLVADMAYNTFSFLAFSVAYVLVLGIWITSATIRRLLNDRPPEKSRIFKYSLSYYRNTWLVASVNVIFTVVLVASLFLLTSITDSSISIRSDYELRLRALRPVLTDLEEEVIDAEWVNIRSKADFDRLDRRMTSVALERKVRLPKPTPHL